MIFGGSGEESRGKNPLEIIGLHSSPVLHGGINDSSFKIKREGQGRPNYEGG